MGVFVMSERKAETISIVGLLAWFADESRAVATYYVLTARKGLSS